MLFFPITIPPVHNFFLVFVILYYVISFALTFILWCVNFKLRQVVATLRGHANQRNIKRQMIR